MDDYVVGAVADIISGKISSNSLLCLHGDVKPIKKTKEKFSRKQKFEHNDPIEESEETFDLMEKKRKKKKQEFEPNAPTEESEESFDLKEKKRKKKKQECEGYGFSNDIQNDLFTKEKEMRSIELNERIKLDSEIQDTSYSQKNKKRKKKQKHKIEGLIDESHEIRKSKKEKGKMNTQGSEHYENSGIASNHNDTDSFLIESGSNMGDREERTVFVGNLPKTVKKLKLKNWLSRFGEIETVRLRSAPIADPRIPKKVAMIKKNFHEQRNSIHAYVRFKKIESAMKALQANGELFGETHHVRIDMATNKSPHDMKKAIFIGNLPFAAEEEDIRAVFQGCGDIESIRIIRDNFTGIGKGIGYVNFKTEDAVQLALQMDNIILGKRNLRIKRAKMKPKKSKLTSEYQKQSSSLKTDKQHILGKHGDCTTEPQACPFQGTLASQKMKQKKKPKKNKGLIKKKNMSQILAKPRRTKIKEKT